MIIVKLKGGGGKSGKVGIVGEVDIRGKYSITSGRYDKQQQHMNLSAAVFTDFIIVRYKCLC